MNGQRQKPNPLSVSDRQRRRGRIFAYASTWFGCYAEVMVDSSAIVILYLTLLQGSATLTMLSTALSALAAIILTIPSAVIGKAREGLQQLGLATLQADALLNANVADSDAGKRATEIKQLQRHIAISARLGVRAVVIHPGGRRDNPNPEVNDRLNIEAFRRLGDIAGDHGIRIAIENMTRPGFTAASEMLGFLGRIRPQTSMPLIGEPLPMTVAHLTPN